MRRDRGEIGLRQKAIWEHCPRQEGQKWRVEVEESNSCPFEYSWRKTTSRVDGSWPRAGSRTG